MRSCFCSRRHSPSAFHSAAEECGFSKITAESRFALYTQHRDLRRMVERRGVGDRRANVIIANEILWHGNQLFDLQVTILAERLERLHILLSADIRCLVYCDQMRAISDKWSDFIDKPRAVLRLVYCAFRRSRKEWGIEQEAIEG